MTLHPVTILAVNHIIISYAEDFCPREINTIFSKHNDLNDLSDRNDQKNLREKLNITKFKPDPPEISKLYDGNLLGKSRVSINFQLFIFSISVRWIPPTQWIRSDDLLFVLELLENEIFYDEDDEDDEEDEEDRLQLRRDFSLSTRDDGVLEIPLDVSDEKYWGVRRVRVKIQGNYQVSEFSTEVKLNIMNAKDEKEFMGKLNQFVREGKNAKIQDMFS